MKMALNPLKTCILKSATLFFLTKTSEPFKRFSLAACSYSVKTQEENQSSTSGGTSTDQNKTKTARLPGIRPELSPKVKVHPHAVRYRTPKMKFVLQGVDTRKYTHRPIPYPKTGGRGWNGRVFNKRMGGGAKQMYRMVDFTRLAISESEPLVEKVLYVRYDPLRSADIALVASGNHKRWILAEENMKAGDIIRSYADIPKTPVVAKVGDAHPLAALAVGTTIHNIEMFEKEGGNFARAAGTSGTIVRKAGDQVIVKLPSGREASLAETCIATVGRVSNIKHGSEHIGSAQRNRWFGVRPKSGLYKKKTGYHGRKIKPPKPMITYEKKTKKSLHEMFDI